MKRPYRAPRTAPLIAALIAAVAAATLALCVATFLRSYRAAAVENARTNSAQAVSQVAGTVGNYVQTLDETIVDVMEELYMPESDRDAYLDAWLDARSEVVAVTTYSARGTLQECWALDHTPRTEILQNLSFDLAAAQADPGGYITAPHVESIFEGYYPWVVTIVRPIPNGAGACWVAVDVSFSGLGDSINGVGIGQHGYCYLMDDQGNMVYHPQQQLLYAGIKTEEAERLAAQPDGTYVEDTVIYSVQDVPASNWRVVGVSYIDETVNESFWQMARITLGSAALILAAALLVGWIISHMLSHPLQKLETAMEQFEQDADGFTFQPVAGTREVQELSDSFGHMVGRIQRLMNTVREEEIVLRKTELKALQAQINPHFLYNTLDAVTWMARLKKEPEIEKLAVNLAKFFRLSLHKGDKFITVGEELELTAHYLEIDKIRFPDRVTVKFETDVSLVNYMTLKLILQPIVENAVKYAFEDQKGCLTIRTRLSDGDIVFEVEDNGVGFDVESGMVSHKKRSELGGFGLKNVNERIKLEYGEKYGLEVFSQKGKGTKVTIRIQKRI